MLHVMDIFLWCIISNVAIREQQSQIGIPLFNVWPCNLNPDFWLEKSRFVSNPRKNFSICKPWFFFQGIYPKKSSLRLTKKSWWPPWKKLCSENLGNFRCHPQNNFSVCRLKGWLYKSGMWPDWCGYYT